jgi:hypothetical protein
MNNIPHWPCPNNCLNWCRTDGSKTNHHPACKHVDASLITVWRVKLDGASYITDEKPDKDESVTVTEERMHREIYEQLPEFQGF